jgi:hypothetical protein
VQRHCFATSQSLADISRYAQQMPSLAPPVLAIQFLTRAFPVKLEEFLSADRAAGRDRAGQRCKWFPLQGAGIGANTAVVALAAEQPQYRRSSRCR